MNVNNDLQGMQQMFSSQEVSKTQSSGATQAANSQAQEIGTDEATLSSAASYAAQAAPDSDVRMDKVLQVQQALAAGTYNVPSSEVASKMIDQMLGK
jgi:flagellar biosynthesis anti-sigma factor FlgM